MLRVTNHRGMWRELFEEQNSRLTEVVRILLHPSGPPVQILKTALAELEHHPFCAPFGTISALRAVVKAAIAHNYAIIDSWIHTASSGPIDYENSGPQPLEALPWAERAAYFLREVLHYSRRDTALLLGISDANVDQLNRFAKQRMGYARNSPDYSGRQRPSNTDAVGSTHSMAFATYE